MMKSHYTTCKYCILKKIVERAATPSASVVHGVKGAGEEGCAAESPSLIPRSEEVCR